MTLELKDIIYLLTYIVSFASVIFSFRARISNLEREVKRLSDALYESKGGLNVVSNRTCKEHRDGVYSKVRETQSELKQLIDKLELINQNIGKLLVYVEMIKQEKE